MALWQVYVLNRDAANRLTISSPLEAHKSFHLTFHMVGLDVGESIVLCAPLPPRALGPPPHCTPWHC